MSIFDTNNEFSNLESSNADKGFYDTLKNYVNKAESDKAASKTSSKDKTEESAKKAK
ncbi:hypothetical protein [Flavobacterium zepuense]|uniref:hypothetical protein n=1 Tax=Flavobacterium zepuense TaxID=2593302 RepID=UPI00163D6045|nr:hypothetical protein [Flavobacterium zepuense]